MLRKNSAPRASAGHAHAARRILAVIGVGASDGGDSAGPSSSHELVVYSGGAWNHIVNKAGRTFVICRAELFKCLSCLRGGDMGSKRHQAWGDSILIARMERRIYSRIIRAAGLVVARITPGGRERWVFEVVRSGVTYPVVFLNRERC